MCVWGGGGGGGEGREIRRYRKRSTYDHLLTNFVDLDSPMLYTMIQPPSFISSADDF